MKTQSEFVYNVETVYQVLSKCFIISEAGKDSTEGAYQTFKEDFRSVIGKEGYITVKKEDFKPRTINEDFLKVYGRIESVAGVDLPVKIDRGYNKTLVIVGEDPLRNIKEKKEVGDSIVFSIPYGVHRPECRSGRQSFYWKLSQQIFDLGYNIYYTDINKLWLKQGESKESIPQDLQSAFRFCLKRELEVIKPSIIISFGKKLKLH